MPLMVPTDSSTSRAPREAPLDPAQGGLQRLLGAPRVVVAVALAAIVALSWVYLLTGAGTGMDPFAMTAWFPPAQARSASLGWTPLYAALMVLMWWVMMIAMMLPSAAPFVLIHARVAARAGQPAVSTAVFLAGYLTAGIRFFRHIICQWINALLDGTANEYVGDLFDLHITGSLQVNFHLFFIQFNRNRGILEIKTVLYFFFSHIHGIVQCLCVYFAYDIE